MACGKAETLGQMLGGGEDGAGTRGERPPHDPAKLAQLEHLLAAD